VLGPFTATWTIVALVATIYMGNPKSFEVIAKTQETSRQREQLPREREEDREPEPELVTMEERA
jgi:hypothetical protein